MSITVTNVGSDEHALNTDSVMHIAADIQRAREENRATSRQHLARALHEKIGGEFKRSSGIVNDYCDEHEAGIPMYLESEFLPGYLKVVAVVLVAVAIGIYVFGINLIDEHTSAWPTMCLGTLILGAGGLVWAKSLNRIPNRP